jgi:hypothetical protein
MELNKTQKEFILAMMETISSLPVSYESVYMDDLESDEILEIANELKAQLENESSNDEIVDGLEEISYEDVVIYLHLQDTKAGDFLCYHDEHDFIMCHLSLDRKNKIIIQNDSDIDIDINDLQIFLP